MTGRVNFTPESERQLDDLDEWITQKASADTARRFVRAVMDYCERILVFPDAGRGRDDVRPGMRTTTFKKRTLIAYEVDDLAEEFVVNVLGVFHGGQDWESALRADPSDDD